MEIIFFFTAVIYSSDHLLKNPDLIMNQLEVFESMSFILKVTVYVGELFAICLKIHFFAMGQCTLVMSRSFQFDF